MLILYVFVDGNEEILTTNSWESNNIDDFYFQYVL